MPAAAAAAAKASLVEIVNDVLNVKVVSDRVPFQQSVEVTGSGETIVGVVPAGQRLVITYVNSYSGNVGNNPLGVFIRQDNVSIARFFFKYSNDIIDTHPNIIVAAGQTLTLQEGNPTEPTVLLSGYFEAE